MHVRRLKIENFRGIQSAELLLPNHAVLIGDNNTGKTTVLEALDLALGPERLNRFPTVDEHDFFEGRYIHSEGIDDGCAEQEEDAEDTKTSTEKQEESEGSDGTEDSAELEIRIEAVIIALSDDQMARFGNYVEWWDQKSDELYDEPEPEGVDREHVAAALRITFVGRYDLEQDDFEGNTYFARSREEDENPTRFGRRDKQFCGFLYLRSLRTGRRALSLERGSLLDIILRLKEIRPQMWEDTILALSSFTVAGDEAHGISGVLGSIDKALNKYVPKDWGANPHLRVSNLTRENLRGVITAFMATGDGDHAAPFYRQGTGTVNMLMLAMLSLIAKDKQNVIFAMEEPETAIPPYAQKRIVQEVRNLASQTLFTSHSPYVLEEFELNETVVLGRSDRGELTQSKVELPDSVKPKRYRQEFRTRFCEGLLANRILVAEGATEATSFPVVARRLAELDAGTYSSLESLGICTVDAGGENNIADVAAMYANLGKRVFAVCDKQTEAAKHSIEAEVESLYMHTKPSTEKLILAESDQSALGRFGEIVDWPEHIKNNIDIQKDLPKALQKYFNWAKGNWGVADFLAQCGKDEMPAWFRETCASLKAQCDDSVESED